jgi:hypothetical protein
MKKIIAILMIIFILSVTAFAAVPDESYKCTVKKSDLSGENYQIYFMGCVGHYANDAITIYVTNTSNREIEFQVIIGYSGSSERPTTAESGYVKIPTGVTGMFVLENLMNIPEKANNELGYVPNSHLSERSVVRIQARGVKEGDTFIVCGFRNSGVMRDTNFSELEAGSVTPVTTSYVYINEAKRVIKAKEEETEVVKYTLYQPPTEVVNGFITFTVASAILCVGGLIIYTVVFIIKRREHND